jgi:hypothetical protein
MSGPLGLEVGRKRIDLLFDHDDIQRRLAYRKPPAAPECGYASLYRKHVLQAPRSCDFDFQVGPSKRAG